MSDRRVSRRRPSRVLQFTGGLLALSIVAIAGCGQADVSGPDVQLTQANSPLAPCSHCLPAQPQSTPVPSADAPNPVLAQVETPADAPAEKPAQAKKFASSIDFVPSDTAFYVSLLNGRQQYDRLATSRAMAAILELPAVKEALEEANKEPDGPLFLYKQQQQNPLVKMYLDFAKDLFSNEVFIYGSGEYVKALELAQTVSNAARLQGFIGGIRGEEPDGKEIVFELLEENAESIEIPDLVIGFKLTNTDAAIGLMAQAELFAGFGLAEAPPEFQGRFKRVKLSGGEFLTFDLDGKLLPWDDIEEEMPDFEEDYPNLYKKLHELTLSVSLGLKGGYLLVSIADNNDHLGNLGSGELLSSIDAFATPYSRFSDQQLSGLCYVSEDMARISTTTPEDFDALVEVAQQVLPETELPEELQQRIEADIKGLAEDIKPALPEPGATFAVSFMVPDGYDEYIYNYGSQPLIETSKPLPVLQHIGNNPILAVASRQKYMPEQYDTLVKWVKIGYGYWTEFGVPELEEEDRAEYDQAAQKLLPIIERLHETTREKLIPALKDGQSALIVDADWTSKEWHPEFTTEEPLPMPELGLVLGVSDQDLFRDALVAYRDLMNEIVLALSQLNPDEVPPFVIPDPQSKDVDAGTLYYFDLPPVAALDEQVQPTLGMGEEFAAIAGSTAHVESLLTVKPLKAPAPLDDLDKPMATAVIFNWAGLVDAAEPWIKYGLAQKEVPEDEIVQVETVLDVVRCMKGIYCSVYAEGDATVTRCHTIFKDLPAAE